MQRKLSGLAKSIFYFIFSIKGLLTLIGTFLWDHICRLNNIDFRPTIIFNWFADRFTEFGQWLADKTYFVGRWLYELIVFINFEEMFVTVSDWGKALWRLATVFLYHYFTTLGELIIQHKYPIMIVAGIICLPGLLYGLYRLIKYCRNRRNKPESTDKYANLNEDRDDDMEE